MKLVVLEGCNGEWSQELYLPFLADKAKQGMIKLWALDVVPKIKLATPKTLGLWRDAKNKDNARYLNKHDNVKPDEIPANVDHVFIAAPDKYHCEIAKFWLEHLNTGGKIFIEKPLDVSKDNTLTLKNKMGGPEICYGFDHYLAKTFPFLHQPCLNEIGKIREIDFNLLEPGIIPLEKSKTLDEGVIYDLFCHVLAVVGATLSRDSASFEATLKSVVIRKVVTAQYTGCQISGETFAQIGFSLGTTEVIATIGKGVSHSDEKCMTIHGENGKIRLDFKENDFVCHYSNHHLKKGYLESKPVESFLEAVLQLEKPFSAPGVLSFEAALVILEKLDESKRKARVVQPYNIGVSAKQIF